MNVLNNICSIIYGLESTISDSFNNDVCETSDINIEDWAYIMMPEPVAGGTENVGTMYN